MKVFEKLQSGENMQNFLQSYFERAGWKVEVVSNDPSLRSRKKGGLSRCGDGRPFEESLSETDLSGYNIFGATAGLAGMIADDRGRSEVTTEDLKEAIVREKKAGIVSGWHNIEGPVVECGYEKKQATEGISEVPKQEFSPASAVDEISAVGGKKADVHGSHDETRLTLILKKGMTAVSIPDDQQFSVDVEFIHNKLKIPLEIIAKHSANTVKTLKPVVNTVRIVA